MALFSAQIQESFAHGQAGCEIPIQPPNLDPWNSHVAPHAIALQSYAEAMCLNLVTMKVLLVEIGFGPRSLQYGHSAIRGLAQGLR